MNSLIGRLLEFQSTHPSLCRSQTLPSNREHQSYGDCLEGKRGDYLISSVLLCITIVQIICTPI